MFRCYGFLQLRLNDLVWTEYTLRDTRAASE